MTLLLGPADVLGLQAVTRAVRVEPVLADYLLDLVHATRDHPDVRLGASTRAALALYRASQAAASSRDKWVARRRPGPGWVASRTKRS